MVIYEDECVGCPQGCINCGRKRVPRYYCDRCGEEIYDDDVDTHASYHLCEKCRGDEE